MVGSESEAIFAKLGVKASGLHKRSLQRRRRCSRDLPPTVICCHFSDANAEASDLRTGVAYLKNKIRSILDKNLGLWEKYCLLQCFNVPEGCCLPESDTYSAVNLPSVDALAGFEREEQLDSLRSKVSQVRKESMELNKELQALQRQSTSTDYFAKIITEAVELSNQSSLHDTFQELSKTADDLAELEIKRMEVYQRKKKRRLDS